MYELTINEKQVKIEIQQEDGVWVFASECDGQHFHSAMNLRAGTEYLLLKKPIVGVGLYSADQETLTAMHAEYKEKAYGVRAESDSNSDTAS